MPHRTKLKTDNAGQGDYSKQRGAAEAAPLCQSIIIVPGVSVFVEKGKAGFAIDLLKIVAKLFTTAHEGVELVVAEAYAVVVGDGAAVVHLIYISPHARA